jgi:hypothetical protein
VHKELFFFFAYNRSMLCQKYKTSITCSASGDSCIYTKILNVIAPFRVPFNQHVVNIMSSDNFC